MNIERNFLENANNIVAENSFKSRKEVKRSLIDKLFLGSRIYFVIRYMMITLKMSSLAKKDKYNYNEFILHAILCFKLLEEVGAKFDIEGIDNIKKVKDEPVVFVGNHMSALETDRKSVV